MDLKTPHWRGWGVKRQEEGREFMGVAGEKSSGG